MHKLPIFGYTVACHIRGLPTDDGQLPCSILCHQDSTSLLPRPQTAKELLYFAAKTAQLLQNPLLLLLSWKNEFCDTTRYPTNRCFTVRLRTKGFLCPINFFLPVLSDDQTGSFSEFSPLITSTLHGIGNVKGIWKRENRGKLEDPMSLNCWCILHSAHL